MPRINQDQTDPWLNHNPFPPDNPYPPEQNAPVQGGPAGGPVPFDQMGSMTGGGGSDMGNFEIPQYGGPGSPSFNFQPPPGFNFPDFMGPSFAEAQNEPGYKFRLQSGVDALQNSAAAKGVLRTGGLPKALTEYGQNFGAQEYANLYNRYMQAYGTNRETAMQRYLPQLHYIEMLNGAEKERAMAEFNQSWAAYLANLNATMQQEGWIQNMQAPPPQPPSY